MSADGRFRQKGTGNTDTVLILILIVLHGVAWVIFVIAFIVLIMETQAGRPGSSVVPRNPLTRWDVSSIPANGIFLTKKLKNKNKNAQRVEND